MKTTKKQKMKASPKAKAKAAESAVGKLKTKAKQAKLLDVEASPKRAPSADAGTPATKPARKNGVQSAAGTGTPRTIPYDDLAPGHNARQVFDEDRIEELAEMIRTQGLKQRLIVYPDAKRRGKYLIHGGHRRYLAIGLLISRGLWAGAVPCEEQADVAESDRQAVGLIENLGRVDLNPVEKAKGCKAAIATGGWVAWDEANKERSLGHLLGFKSKSTIYSLLNLATLCPVAEAALALWPNEGGISPAVADKLARVRDPQVQNKLAGQAISERWTDKVAAERVAMVQKQLKGAPFDPKDATLVPRNKDEGWGGPCATCPCRSGNQAEMFGEFEAKGGRGDMCLRTACFDAKALAAWDRQALDHESRGGKVLTVAEAEKIGLTKRWSSPGGGYVDLAESPDYGDKEGNALGTIGELCAQAVERGELVVTLARANDGSGRIYRLVDQEAAYAIMEALPAVKQALAANDAPSPRQPLSPDNWKVSQERGRRVDQRRWELLATALPDMIPAVDVLRVAVAAFSNHHRFYDLLGVSGAENLNERIKKRIEEASSQQVWEWFLFLTAIGGDRTMDMLCATQELDAEAIEVRAESEADSRETIAAQLNAEAEMEDLVESLMKEGRELKALIGPDCNITALQEAINRQRWESAQISREVATRLFDALVDEGGQK